MRLAAGINATITKLRLIPPSCALLFNNGAIAAILAGAYFYRIRALIEQIAQYVKHRFFLLVRIAVLIVVDIVMPLGMIAVALLIASVLA